MYHLSSYLALLAAYLSDIFTPHATQVIHLIGNTIDASSLSLYNFLLSILYFVQFTNEIMILVALMAFVTVMIIYVPIAIVYLAYFFCVKRTCPPMFRNNAAIELA